MIGLDQFGISIVRTLTCALLSCAIAAMGTPVWNGATRRRGASLVWCLLLLPFIVPALVLGYAYSYISLALVRHPWAKEGLYAGLLVMRLVPIATIAGIFCRPSSSREATHCAALLPPGRQLPWRARVGLWLCAGGRAWAVAFVATCLLAGTEMELASLLCVDTWTVMLFDAQVGGLALHASLFSVLPGLVLQLAMLWAVVRLLGQTSDGVAIGSSFGRNPRGIRTAMSGCYLAATTTAAFVVPAAICIRDLRRNGFPGGSFHMVIGDIAVSVFLASLVAFLAQWVSRLATAEGTPGRVPRVWLLAAPGLLGGLVLGLATVSFFSLPGLRILRDSPLPLVLALTALVLPFAVLVRFLARAATPAESAHAADLLAAAPSARTSSHGKRIASRLRGPVTATIAGVAFILAYFELTASAILSPPGMTPVTVRLYNLMHYGRTPALSAMVILAVGLPLFILALGLACERCRALHLERE